jgi:hypothetical protein
LSETLVDDRVNVGSPRSTRRHSFLRPRQNRSSTLVGIARIVIALLSVLSVAAPSSADIFKCTAKGAMPTYQNFPCEFDSLGAVPTAGSSGTASPAAHAGPAGAKSIPATSATIPRVGMTANEVRKIWGEPLETTREEFVKGQIQTWKYADSRSILFDARGRVKEISW